MSAAALVDHLSGFKVSTVLLPTSESIWLEWGGESGGVPLFIGFVVSWSKLRLESQKVQVL